MSLMYQVFQKNHYDYLIIWLILIQVISNFNSQKQLKILCLIVFYAFHVCH